MTTTRVVVIDDSLTVRRRIVETLAAAPGIVVVGEGGDGKRAIELCQELRPDVVTMDMMMPLMSGVAATEFIMAYCPTPILIVSASTNRGELFKTYDALAAGAVDVLEKPRGDEPDGVWERGLIDAVKMVARIRVITHPRARLAALHRGNPTTSPPALAPARLDPPPRGRHARLVAIGASTGGPAALVNILHALPVGFAPPVVIVLHIGVPFATAFADWLDAQSRHRVSYARDGERLADVAGRVVMAPPDRHLVVRGERLALTRDPERHSCRPSVDVLFESIARELAATATACLLTGMGRDGAAGLLAIRLAGGQTIAQDEATSVVFGMPREAILLGAAQHIAALAQIAPLLVSLSGEVST